MKKLLFATCFILAFASCKKEKHGPPPDNPYGLPNATSEGKNIFACRVNGQNWISETGIYNMGGGVSNDSLTANGGRNSSGAEDIFLLRIGAFQENITYNLNGETKITYTTTRLCNSNVINFYAYEAITGFIKLSKIDITRKILSGTFSFIIIRQECNDTLNFTDGRFDIKYY